MSHLHLCYLRLLRILFEAHFLLMHPSFFKQAFGWDCDVCSNFALQATQDVHACIFGRIFLCLVEVGSVIDLAPPGLLLYLSQLSMTDLLQSGYLDCPSGVHLLLVVPCLYMCARLRTRIIHRGWLRGG